MERTNQTKQKKNMIFLISARRDVSRMNENRMQQAKIAKRNEFDISEEEEKKIEEKWDS
jgi:hypothetical protein